MDVNDVLGTYFPNINGLHKEQEEAIDLLVKGANTLCLLPTGFGKSLIYQVTGLSLEKTTVVIRTEGQSRKMENGKWVNGKCKSVTWNGKTLPNFQIAVKELKKGGELTFHF